MEKFNPREAVTRAYYSVHGETINVTAAASLMVAAGESVVYPNPLLLAATTIPPLVLVGVAKIESIRKFEPQKPFLVGDHLKVNKNIYRATEKRTLSDGLVIHPGHVGGELHMISNMSELRFSSQLSAGRYFYNSAIDSLEALAELCQSNDRKVDGIEFFYGRTKLNGRLADEAGFDTFPINDLFTKFLASKTTEDVGRHIVKIKNGDSYISNMNEPMELVISRNRLIEKHGY